MKVLRQELTGQLSNAIITLKFVRTLRKFSPHVQIHAVYSLRNKFTIDIKMRHKITLLCVE